MNAMILACSSLTPFIKRAQTKCKTAYPVWYLDQSYHRDPKLMRQQIITALAEIPEAYDTLLVAMGYCGGSWANISLNRRVVLPRVDDCITLLLTTDDDVQIDRKKPGHLYIKEANPAKSSFKAIFDRYTADMSPEEANRIYASWKETYSGIKIIDTGLYDSYSAEYTQSVDEDAAWLDAKVTHVPGGTLLLEKLFSGQWDAQFAVIEAGQRTLDDRKKIR